VGEEVANEAAGPDARWLALHAERESLERALSLAQARQRFGSDAAAVERARAEEAELLLSLDRVLTQIRAAEYSRRPGARRW
jgi:hypothetical protein